MTAPVPVRIGVDVPDVDLLVVQNETFRGSFVHRIDGVPQSLQGYSAYLSVASKPGAEPFFTLSTAPGDGLVVEPDGQTGVVGVVMSAARTALLRRNARYDLLLVGPVIDAGPETDRLVGGAVFVSPAVTRLPEGLA